MSPLLQVLLLSQTLLTLPAVSVATDPPPQPQPQGIPSRFLTPPLLAITNRTATHNDPSSAILSQSTTQLDTVLQSVSFLTFSQQNLVHSVGSLHQSVSSLASQLHTLQQTVVALANQEQSVQQSVSLLVGQQQTVIQSVNSLTSQRQNLLSSSDHSQLALTSLSSQHAALLESSRLGHAEVMEMLLALQTTLNAQMPFGQLPPRRRLGDACRVNNDCNNFVTYSECGVDDICVCPEDRWAHGKSSCRPILGLGDSCRYDEDCSHDIRGSTCKNDECVCAVAHVADYEYRLRGGSLCHSGRVELRRSGGDWGLVCDDHWDNTDADVVCRSLDFLHGTAHNKSMFGGNDNFHMDDIKCVGTESSLIECPYAGWDTENCSGEEVAGVTCRM